MTLPVKRAHELQAVPEEERWLIEGLWQDRAVGIVGGEPKSCKTFLALDMAVSIASGTSCLGCFRAKRTGRVLLYCAEDPLHVVKERLEGIARIREKKLEDLEIFVITAPALRLDIERDQELLRQAVSSIRPLLLILDPFVRLHRIDENQANEVAPLLAYLRQLERQLQTAVCLVHHSRKGAAHIRAGQALRGSSELHAWGDSNLYIRRKGERLRLTIEHRAAPAPDDVFLDLCVRGSIALQAARGEPAPEKRPPDSQRVEDALAHAGRPLSLRELRGACRMKMETLCGLVTRLTLAGRIEKTPQGYRVLPSPMTSEPGGVTPTGA